jgi:RNA polymerase sigma factor (sigma-70 family)
MMLSVGPQRDPSGVADEDVYARHAQELTRFATVLAGPSAAADLVAAAVAKAFAHPGWRTVDNRRAYLYRAVLNEARQAARSDVRRQRREQLAAPVEQTGGEPSVRPEVLAAVRRLDRRQRAIVFFTYWQDRTPAEIADDLGVTVRTVQRELADARTRLLEHLR